MAPTKKKEPKPPPKFRRNQRNARLIPRRRLIRIRCRLNGRPIPRMRKYVPPKPKVKPGRKPKDLVEEVLKDCDFDMKYLPSDVESDYEGYLSESEDPKDNLPRLTRTQSSDSIFLPMSYKEHRFDRVSFLHKHRIHHVEHSTAKLKRRKMNRIRQKHGLQYKMISKEYKGFEEMIQCYHGNLPCLAKEIADTKMCMRNPHRYERMNIPRVFTYGETNLVDVIADCLKEQVVLVVANENTCDRQANAIVIGEKRTITARRDVLRNLPTRRFPKLPPPCVLAMEYFLLQKIRNRSEFELHQRKLRGLARKVTAYQNRPNYMLDYDMAKSFVKRDDIEFEEYLRNLRLRKIQLDRRNRRILISPRSYQAWRQSEHNRRIQRREHASFGNSLRKLSESEAKKQKEKRAEDLKINSVKSKEDNNKIKRIAAEIATKDTAFKAREAEIFQRISKRLGKYHALRQEEAMLNAEMARRAGKGEFEAGPDFQEHQRLNLVRSRRNAQRAAENARRAARNVESRASRRDDRDRSDQLVQDRMRLTQENLKERRRAEAQLEKAARDSERRKADREAEKRKIEAQVAQERVDREAKRRRLIQEEQETRQRAAEEREKAARIAEKRTADEIVAREARKAEKEKKRILSEARSMRDAAVAEATSVSEAEPADGVDEGFDVAGEAFEASYESDHLKGIVEEERRSKSKSQETEAAREAKQASAEAEKARKAAERVRKAFEEAENVRKAEKEAGKAKRAAEDAEKARKEDERAKREEAKQKKAVEEAKRKAEKAESSRKILEKAQRERNAAKEAERQRRADEEAAREAAELERARRAAEKAQQDRAEAEQQFRISEQSDFNYSYRNSVEPMEAESIRGSARLSTRRSSYQTRRIRWKSVEAPYRFENEDTTFIKRSTSLISLKELMKSVEKKVDFVKKTVVPEISGYSLPSKKELLSLISLLSQPSGSAHDKFEVLEAMLRMGEKAEIVGNAEVKFDLINSYLKEYGCVGIVGKTNETEVSVPGKFVLGDLVCLQSQFWRYKEIQMTKAKELLEECQHKLKKKCIKEFELFVRSHILIFQLNYHLLDYLFDIIGRRIFNAYSVYDSMKKGNPTFIYSQLIKMDKKMAGVVDAFFNLYPLERQLEELKKLSTTCSKNELQNHVFALIRHAIQHIRLPECLRNNLKNLPDITRPASHLESYDFYELSIKDTMPAGFDEQTYMKLAQKHKVPLLRKNSKSFVSVPKDYFPQNMVILLMDQGQFFFKKLAKIMPNGLIDQNMRVFYLHRVFESLYSMVYRKKHFAAVDDIRRIGAFNTSILLPAIMESQGPVKEISDLAKKLQRCCSHLNEKLGSRKDWTVYPATSSIGFFGDRDWIGICVGKNMDLREEKVDFGPLKDSEVAETHSKGSTTIHLIVDKSNGKLFFCFGEKAKSDRFFVTTLEKSMYTPQVRWDQIQRGYVEGKWRI